MALSKIQAESINLADTFAFTGTVSGAGSPTLSSVQTVSSAVASIDTTVPSGTTIITMVFRDLSLASSDEIVMQVATSGGLLTGNDYIGHSTFLGTGSYNASSFTTYIKLGVSGFTATDNSFNGIMQLRSLNGQYWSYSGQASSITAYVGVGSNAGRVNLGSNTDITSIRIKGAGGSNIDAGSFKFYFE